MAMFLNPMKPERLDHMIVAFACLGITGVAVVYSLLTGIGLL
jgi:hypothetical protein